MGWKYFSFRILYELKRKSGLLKRFYPTDPKSTAYIDLKQWKDLPVNFFFNAKESLSIEKYENEDLEKGNLLIRKGELLFFNAQRLKHIDWLVNPDSKHQYDIKKHWSEVEDFSVAAGDIKFVWEKSRFSWIYDLIRYDHHYKADSSAYIFSEIDSWIKANPINQGPNYKCSQEISLRILNWMFVLHYYKNAPSLTEERFQKILHFIYWQLRHVYSNINFSRIAVRNNHAITETLMLYIGGLFFPFFPESQQWKKDGKKWFEEEIAYQIYEDGTYLQFSNNYHRVVIQLCTWAFHLAHLNGDQFNQKTYDRAYRSLSFLYHCQSEKNGQLPNYGANDGALFFKLNNCDYRDYRPQLNALHFYLTGKPLYEKGPWTEDMEWYGQSVFSNKFQPLKEKDAISSYPIGGFYILRDKESTTFIRCGNHKDRPSHADNLHIDIWYKGENILRDAGTYKYNTDQKLVDYFTGSKAHNTVVLGDHHQMKKGPRFIWLNWSQALKAEVVETPNSLEFQGEISAFQQVEKGITHQRSIVKIKNKAEWVIKDIVHHNSGLPIHQYWHPNNERLQLHISSISADNKVIEPVSIKSYYSGYYGIKENTNSIMFSSKQKQISSTIKVL